MRNSKNIFKNKKFLLVAWGGGCETHYQCRDWKPFFNKFFGEFYFFNPRDEYYLNGKDVMNESFLETVKKEKPDYILFALSYDEFYPQTIMQIKSISPNTTTIAFFGDDCWRYDDWSRYYAPLFDYIITSEKDNSFYFKDGIKQVYFLHGINLSLFSPRKLKKLYDVGFIGSDISDRYNFLKFLLDNKIKIKIFGTGWDKYPNLKNYIGPLVPKMEDYVEMINKTKINLNFSKTLLEGKRNKQFKGRVLEISACKSFMLTEDFPEMESFLRGITKISFKTKEELLRKVRYYLKNEKERERITNENYQQVIKNYSWNSLFSNFFENISKKEIKRKLKLPQINKKIYILSEKDYRFPAKLKNKLRNFDYISFKTKKTITDRYKNYFQAYSLKKSGKQISCCDYYVRSYSLRNYLLFMAKKSFQRIDKKDFNSLLNINQLMVTKDYFLKNFEKFKQIFKNGRIDLINNENTVFVSIPLLQINKLNKTSYPAMKEAFRPLFIEKFYSLKYKKKLLFSPYPYLFVLTSLFNKQFILKYFFDILSDKERWAKLNVDKIG